MYDISSILTKGILLISGTENNRNANIGKKPDYGEDFFFVDGYKIC